VSCYYCDRIYHFWQTIVTAEHQGDIRRLTDAATAMARDAERATHAAERALVTSARGSPPSPENTERNNAHGDCEIQPTCACTDRNKPHSQHRAARRRDPPARDPSLHTLWGQRRTTARHVIASEAMAAAEKIALAMIRVKLATESCLAETARLETDIAAYDVHQLALQADELEAMRKVLPARMEDEASLEKLRRDVQRAKLNAELHAVQAPDAFHVSRGRSPCASTLRHAKPRRGAGG